MNPLWWSMVSNLRNAMFQLWPQYLAHPLRSEWLHCSLFTAVITLPSPLSPLPLLQPHTLDSAALCVTVYCIQCIVLMDGNANTMLIRNAMLSTWFNHHEPSLLYSTNVDRKASTKYMIYKVPNTKLQLQIQRNKYKYKVKNTNMKMHRKVGNSFVGTVALHCLPES